MVDKDEKNAFTYRTKLRLTEKHRREVMILHLAKVFFSLIRAWRVRENTKSNPCKETIEGLVDCQLSGYRTSKLSG